MNQAKNRTLIEMAKDLRYFTIGYLARVAVNMKLRSQKGSVGFLTKIFQEDLRDEMDKNKNFATEKNIIYQKIKELLGQNTKLAGHLISRYMAINSYDREIKKIELKIEKQRSALDQITPSQQIDLNHTKISNNINNLQEKRIKLEEKKEKKVLRQLDDFVTLFKSNKELLTDQVNLYFKFVEPTFIQYAHFLVIEEFKKFQNNKELNNQHVFSSNLKPLLAFLNQDTLKEIYKNLNKKEFAGEDADNFLKLINIAPNASTALSLKESFSHLKNIVVLGLDHIYEHMREQPIIKEDGSKNNSNIINQLLNLNKTKEKTDYIPEKELAAYQEKIKIYVEKQEKRTDRKTDLSDFSDVKNVKKYSELFKILHNEKRINGKDDILKELISSMRDNVADLIDANKTRPLKKSEQKIDFIFLTEFFRDFIKNSGVSKELKSLANSKEVDLTITSFKDRCWDVPMPVKAAKFVFANLEVDQLLDNILTGLQKEAHSDHQHHLENSLKYFLLSSGQHQGALSIIGGTALKGMSLSDEVINKMSASFNVNPLMIRLGLDAITSQASSAEKGGPVFFNPNMSISFLTSYTIQKTSQLIDNIKDNTIKAVDLVSSNIGLVVDSVTANVASAAQTALNVFSSMKSWWSGDQQTAEKLPEEQSQMTRKPLSYQEKIPVPPGNEMQIPPDPSSLIGKNSFYLKHPEEEQNNSNKL